MLKDAFDETIHVGDFYVKTGLGNRDGHYGIVLYRCIDTKKCQFEYLYFDRPTSTPKIKVKMFANLKKGIVIKPPERVIQYWNKMYSKAGQRIDPRSASQFVKWLAFSILPKSSGDTES